MAIPRNSRVEAVVAIILWIILATLVTTSIAVAQKIEPPVESPTWAVEVSKREYKQRAEAAGPNYQTIAVAYREYYLRSEMALAACLATYGRTHYPKSTSLVITKHCYNKNSQWMIWLNQAIVDTGGFPYAYMGQTAIALVDVKRIHKVIRHTHKRLTPTDARQRMVLKKYVVPMLIFQLAEAIATGEIPNPETERYGGPS